MLRLTVPCSVRWYAYSFLQVKPRHVEETGSSCSSNKRWISAGKLRRDGVPVAKVISQVLHGGSGSEGEDWRETLPCG